MGPIMVKIVIAVIALAIGALIGYIYRKNVGEKAIGSAEQKARNLILDAENRSESMKKEAILEAKEEAHRLRSEAERDARERRAEIQRSERRLIQKEESMDRKLENIERKEESITQKEQAIINRQKELELVIAKQMEELERISGYTAEEAKTILLANTEKEVRHEASVMIKEIETKAKEEADKKAKYIITGAIQRCAADHVAESTGFCRCASKRRNEGSYHRSRRQEHQSHRNAHRRGSDYRRHTGGSDPVRLRSGQKRDRADCTRKADRGRTYSPGKDRGNGRESDQRGQRHHQGRGRTGYV